MTRFITAKKSVPLTLALGILVSVSMMGAPVDRAAQATSVSVSSPAETVAARQPSTVDVVVDGNVVMESVVLTLVSDPIIFPSVSVSPPTQTVAAGQPFTVNIVVDPHGASIAGMGFDLSFNLSVITANGLTEGNLLNQAGASTNFSAGTIDNLAGTITGVAGVITTPGQAVSTPGTFATIDFTAGEGSGSSPLHLVNVTVRDVDGAPVDFRVNGGSVIVPRVTPGTPSLVSPSNGEGNVSTTLGLDWSDVSGATSYDLQICSDSGCSSLVRSAYVGSSEWTVSPALAQGTAYYWRVRANNSCGSGSWTSMWSFATLPAATSVNISPPTQTVAAGQTFSVDVVVDPGVAIAGVQFSLGFDPSLLTANGVTEGNLLTQGGASSFFYPGTINNVAGTIANVVGVIVTPGQSVLSAATFATISFTAKTTAGASALDLYDVIVGDPQGQPVSITVSDGSITVDWPDWDVNLDSSVNVLDLILVAKHLGETGAAHWIRQDVNRDGAINVLDMIPIGQHWTG